MRDLYLFSSLLLSFFCCQYPLQGQLLINELCASNDSVIEDNYGESADWIELYNASEEPVHLEGYYISDDPAEPYKWALPAIAIPADGYLLIFASDRNEYGASLHANFKLSADGENVVLTDESGEAVDQVNFPPLATDVSMGRATDGSPQWAIFNVPTPGFSNNNSIGTGFADSPQWATTEHFFAGPTAVSFLSPGTDARIYFTRDGATPNENSELYTGAIALDTTTAIRAIAVEEGKLPSPLVNRTFFIGEQHELPIVSLIGEPADFWSWEQGIMINGGPNAQTDWPYWGANFWSEEELPVYTEFFTEEKNLGIAFSADTKIHGGRGARTQPMKPLRIMVKKKYGSDTVEYPFFSDRERNTYKRLILRNASGDYNNAHFRDAFLARYFIKSDLNLDVLAHRPVVVYINGYYYGVVNLREKSDAYYLKHNYGVDIDKLDLLEEDTIVVEGDFTVFDTMYHYVMSHDMTDPFAFEQAGLYFDTENIAEGFIVQSALNNGDWLHNNIKYWRERRADARWRYLIFDLDIAMGRHGWSSFEKNNLDSLITPQLERGNRHAQLFVQLLANEQYRHYFINRYADLLNTIFRPEIFRKEVDLTVAEIEPEMHRHFSQWTWPGFDVWKNERVATVYDYLEYRPHYAREDIMDYFGLSHEVSLVLNTYPWGAGQIKINTITPEQLPWDGIYFNGVPVTLEIVPNPGFTFSHWQSEKTIADPDPSSTVQYYFSEDDQVTAYFSGGSDKLTVDAYVDEGGQLQIQLQLPTADNIQLSFYDVSGRLLQLVYEGDLSRGLYTYSLSAGALPAGIYIVSAGGTGGISSKRVVVFK
jgi:hypothetical protein